ncbi:MAG: hypothetical protein ACSHWU_00940 [Marinicella sp.]
MIKMNLKTLMMAVLTWASFDSTAVQVSPRGVGEVLIFPYYTVNNNLNTLYSIVNTTADTKAIKIRFNEGEIGHEVLLFNVYMSAFDVWTGALISSPSTIPGHVGESSISHVTEDTTCAPFLNKAGQEFLPYIIDLDQPNNDMLRSREGYIEVLEMAVFTGLTATVADHGGIGIPASCTTIENFWINGGEWNGDSENPPSGGLFGSASIVDVAEGLSLSYDAIALENFWQQAGEHSDPGSLTPNLSSASPESTVLLNSGELAHSEWATGIEAVSSVLMAANVYNEYAYDAFIDGKTEWVITHPTKKFHSYDVDAAIAPYSSLWDGAHACESFDIKIFDREEQINPSDLCCIGTPPPSPPLPELCYASNVIEFIHPADSPQDRSKVLGSDNLLSVSGVVNSVATENGWADIDLILDNDRTMTPVSGTSYIGLPVTGFAVQKFTNAGAAEGLLAQYGSLFVHKGLVVTEDSE